MSEDISGAVERAEPLELGRLAADTEQALQDLDVRIAPLLAERSRLEARLRLLEEVRATYAGDKLSINPHGVALQGRARPRLVSVRSGETTAARIQRQVMTILEEVGDDGPVHSNELRDEFLRRGWEIPGAGKPNNITTHLTTAP